MAHNPAPARRQDPKVYVRKIHRRDLNRAWEFLKEVFRSVHRNTVEYQRPRSRELFFDVYDMSKKLRPLPETLPPQPLPAQRDDAPRATIKARPGQE